jgi:hypothetical protein
MANPTNDELHLLLTADLKKAGSDGLGKVLNDSARKIFVAKKDGVVFEFGHKQSDAAYWNGLKYYGSGSRSKFRIRRTPPAVAA